ncbi:MAG: glycosyltransferase family A protein [Gammaproteobacteria bacterium]|nr:glycosyltransferase family A protein [Gammaproteobacteria bacterium]
MVSNNRVSVLLSTYNRADFIGVALDSILGQSKPPDQVVVINDGSTDRTVEVIEKYLDQVTYLEQENGGKASALNNAMPLIDGDFLWIFDDDDIAFPYALEILSRALSENADAAFAYGGYIAVKDKGYGALEKLKEVPPLELTDDEFLSRLMYGDFLGTPGMLFRTSAMRSVGLFDTALMRCQDYDMKLRLARRYRVVRVDSYLFKRRYHDQGLRGGKNSPFSMRDFGAVALQYEGILFEKVRDNFGLIDFLPGRPVNREGHSTVTGIRRREALFQRMRVMAVHGLWEYAVDDLSAAIDNLLESGAPPLSSAEKWCCHDAMSDVFSTTNLLEKNRHTVHRIRLLCRQEGAAAVILELSKGLAYVRPRLCRSSPDPGSKMARYFRRIACNLRIYWAIVRWLGIKGLLQGARAKFIPPTRGLG